MYSELDGWAKESGSNEGDTTSRDGIRRADLAAKMELVQTAAKSCAEYEQAVFEYVILGERPKDVPGEFWYFYRKFFWELSRLRN